MKSIKRGRGPSFMGGVAAIGAALFGVIWMTMAFGIGAPPLFACAGLIFIGLAVAEAIYNFKNAAGKNRYSEYDIVDSHEESDPLNEIYGQRIEEVPSENKEEFGFCPYCGAKRAKDYVYCGKCGRKLS